MIKPFLFAVIGIDHRNAIEQRKYCDIGGKAGGDHLFLTNSTRCERIVAADAGLPYFENLIHDVRHRTETAVTLGHAFKVMELGLKAQATSEAGK